MYSLFRLGHASSLAGHWPAFFVHFSDFEIPAAGLRSWYSESIQRRQLKHSKLNRPVQFYPPTFVQLLSFCLVYFQKPSFLVIFVFLSPVSLHFNLLCHPFPITPPPPSPLRVWVLPRLGPNQPSKNRWPSLTHIHPTDLTSDKDELPLRVKHRSGRKNRKWLDFREKIRKRSRRGCDAAGKEECLER